MDLLSLDQILFRIQSLQLPCLIQLKEDCEEFCRQMRLKWHFRDEPTPEFGTRPALNPKSAWKPTNNGASLEPFLSQIEDLFEISKTTLGYSNFSKRNANPVALQPMIGK